MIFSCFPLEMHEVKQRVHRAQYFTPKTYVSQILFNILCMPTPIKVLLVTFPLSLETLKFLPFFYACVHVC